jgi:hypothetical protein
MKNFLAFVGGLTVILAVLGLFGVGNFVYVYGADKITCTKESV